MLTHILKLLGLGLSKENSSWLVHLTGIERLLAHQGATHDWTPVSWTIFEHSRKFIVREEKQAKLILNSVSPIHVTDHDTDDAPACRSTVVLAGKPRVAGRGRAASNSDPEHQICSFGLRLSIIVNDCDELLQKQSKCMAQAQKLLNTTSELFQSLQLWHRPCTCYERQPVPFPQPLQTIRCIQSSYPLNSESEKQPIHCILLTAMQLHCCRLVRAIVTGPALAQIDNKIPPEAFSTEAFSFTTCIRRKYHTPIKSVCSRRRCRREFGLRCLGAKSRATRVCLVWDLFRRVRLFIAKIHETHGLT